MAKDKLLQQFHEYLGEFVFTFENMLHVMKETMLQVMNQHGLKNDSLYDILIHESTANQLLNSFRGFVFSQKEKEIDKKVQAYLSELYKLIKKNIEARNELLHSTYGMMGYPDPETNKMIVKLSAKKFKVSEGKLVNAHKDRINEEIIHDISGKILLCMIATRKLFLIGHILVENKNMNLVFSWDSDLKQQKNVKQKA